MISQDQHNTYHSSALLIKENATPKTVAVDCSKGRAFSDDFVNYVRSVMEATAKQTKETNLANPHQADKEESDPVSFHQLLFSIKHYFFVLIHFLSQGTVKRWCRYHN
jgi:hypothetical protein